ncbi:MAG TPA: TIGR02281 family clan AA aspartic protease [Roseiarcus sp.]|nr:TIGR02281 family clan AA aspartic protease [Roseiarcus sp.]
MLKIALIFAAAAGALGLLAPQLLLRLQPAPAAGVAVAAAAPAAPAQRRADGFGEKSIAADAGGQYSLDVLIGGQNVHMMVDTGATMVVISAAVADRLGLSPEAGRKWRVHTANGDSIATEALLPSVDLGTIYMKDVPALIAPRDAGEVNLLGASFLKRLAGVESRNGVLVLRQ